MNPSRYILPLAGVLLAIACIAFATHALVTDVLPYQWPSTTDAPASIDSVQLPAV